ncbi:deoxyribonucleotide triphosphate pyrophosphatase, partial [mine drainage metagenome]
HADDPLPLLGEGRWSGSILHAPRGSDGFGYDPVFLDAARGVAAAELDAALKNHISHRARACAALRAQWPPRCAP